MFSTQHSYQLGRCKSEVIHELNEVLKNSTSNSDLADDTSDDDSDCESTTANGRKADCTSQGRAAVREMYKELRNEVLREKREWLSCCTLPPEFDFRYIKTIWGTHHSKFALLYCKTGLRVVVTTANLVPHKSTDSVWTQVICICIQILL